MKYTLFFAALFCLNIASAQQNLRLTYSKGVGGQFGGPTSMASVYYNAFLDQNSNIEFGFGLIGAYGGYRYYFGKADNPQVVSPYVGALVSIIPPLTSKQSTRLFYFPIGIQAMSKDGWNVSLEVAPILMRELGAPSGTPNDKLVFGALRFGKNF